MSINHLFPPKKWLVMLSLPLAGVLLSLPIIWYLQSHRVRIPSAVAEATPFTIYVPTKLPAHYHLKPESFHYDVREKTLVFEVTDNAGDHIIFTEQRKPTDIDFGKFAQSQLTNATTLQAPFPTATGKSLDKQTTLMSTVADQTWILMSTSVPFTNQELQSIAKSFKKR